jgi:antitoxin component of MazEF toxin-antitoxin module
MKIRLEPSENGLLFHLPNTFLEGTGLQAYSEVNIHVEGQQLVIDLKAQASALDSLLAQITADNKHGEVATGEAQGDEICFAKAHPASHIR